MSPERTIDKSCCQLIFFPFGCHACRFLLVLLPPEKKSDTFVSWEAKPIWQGIRMLSQTASKVHMAGQLLLNLDQIKALSHNGRVAVGSEFFTISRNSNQVQPMVSSKTSIRLSCCQLIFFPFGCHACRFLLFSPLLGDDSHFDQYFSTGLKPPTRLIVRD